MHRLSSMSVLRTPMRKSFVTARTLARMWIGTAALTPGSVSNGKILEGSFLLNVVHHSRPSRCFLWESAVVSLIICAIYLGPRAVLGFYAWEYQLMKMLSLLIGDGKCAIDVVHGFNKPKFDFSSFEEIRMAATRIIETCVDATENPQGGSLGGIGRRITYYQPYFCPLWYSILQKLILKFTFMLFASTIWLNRLL